MDVAQWLRKLDLAQYEAIFRQHDITAAVLPGLLAEDLKDLGITVVGHRRRLLDAIAALRAGTQAAGDPNHRAGAGGFSQHETRPSGERRQIVVMFCDLMDFTPLSSRLDPEDLSAVIRDYQACVATTITRFGGFIARYVGDGVLIYFGWPEAREADAEQAVRAALEVIHAIAPAPIRGERLQVRIGIATGLVVVGEPIGSGESRQQTAIGETPNLAARLQALADANAVLIDSMTHRQLGGLFDCRDLGEVTLKGFSERVPVWQVLGERMVQSRFKALHGGKLGPMIGRENELDTLIGRWRQARDGDGGQAVLVLGEAGIGKSRLIAALEQRLEDEAPARQHFFCSPHHTDTPLHPVIAALEYEAGFAAGDTELERLRKLQSALAVTSPTPQDGALIAELLSIPIQDRPPVLDASPQMRKERTIAALIERLRRLAQTNPLLLILEDMHWADASSIEFFDAVIKTLPAIPALVLVTMRGEDIPAWIQRDGVGTLRLPRLDRRQATALATSISSGAALPLGLLERIVDQTDGVPLFVEELTKTVVEAAPVGTNNGMVSGPFAVPVTLQASLMARLDRIAAAKEVAQVGAIFGREFSHALVATVAGLPEAALQYGLDQLVEAGLASRQGRPPDASYSFKHALVRDTAYGMLLRSRRRDLHARAAAALEQQSPELQDRQPELLAHHYTEAGLAEPAIAYWSKAGRHSVARSAMVEAAAQLRQALQLLPERPDGPARMRQELELQSMLAGALFASHAWAARSAVEAYTRALELAEQLGDVEAMVPVLGGLVTYHIGQGQLRDAREIAAKLLAIAEHANTVSRRLLAHRCMAVCLHWTGAFAGAVEQFDLVLSLYDPAQHRQLATVVGFDLGVQAAFLVCWDLLILGYPDQALARFEIALARCRDVDDKHSLAFALAFGGIFSQLAQDEERAFRQFTGAVELATEQKFPHWLSLASIGVGSILAARGDVARGLAMARDGYSRYVATGAAHAGTGLVVNMTYYLAVLAGACEAAGAPDDARAHLDAAIDAVERSGECWFEPELHRLKGEWLLRHALGREADAEAEFRSAIEQATGQKARLWELRASVSLARLHVARGHTGRAADTLAPVYGWFREGFDLPDFRQAGALLASISA